MMILTPSSTRNKARNREKKRVKIEHELGSMSWILKEQGTGEI